MLKDSTTGYGLVTILLHWTCALLVIFLFGLGLYMRSLDYYSPWYNRGPNLHISLGILVFALMSLRAVWRLRNQSPTRISTISPFIYFIANAVKFALYFCVFVICISGYFITTADGKSANFFGLFSIPPIFQLGATNVDLAGLIHEYVAWGIIGIATIHGGAAIFHHFVKRDRTLLRMLKPTDASSAELEADPAVTTDSVQKND
ncbi:MAG: cytochrome b [Moraxellaceae bacterium]|nr:MAG: cytochrome b [Moraxellaceae bacterium]